MAVAAMAVCLGAAWTLALAFLRADRKQSVPIPVCAALGAVLLQILLLHLGWSSWALLLPAAVSLITAILLPAVLHCTVQDAFTASLMAAGFGTVLWSGAWNGLLFVLLAAVSLVLGALLYRQFPQPAWREEPDTAARSAILPWHVDALLAALCVPSIAAGLLRAETAARWGLCLLAAGSWWLGFGLVLALLACRRAALAAASEKQYRAEMETFMNVIRSQRHDYLFHVRTLSGLTRKGDLEACRSYVEELVQDSTDMNELLPIRDPAISATIFSFRALAAREGISLHIDVQNDLSHICTNVYETNKIIGNLLQNAIDEVCTHPDKSYGIWLYILKRGQYCVIHTANELLIPPEGDYFRQGYTTKQGHEGVGLTSIRLLAERNHGQVYARLEDNVIHFIAKIPLRFETVDEDRYRRDG